MGALASRLESKQGGKIRERPRAARHRVEMSSTSSEDGGVLGRTLEEAGRRRLGLPRLEEPGEGRVCWGEARRPAWRRRRRCARSLRPAAWSWDTVFQVFQWRGSRLLSVSLIAALPAQASLKLDRV